MWTFILVIVILACIKILMRAVGGLILVVSVLTDNDIEESAAGTMVLGLIKCIVTVPILIWGLILLF